MLGSLLISIGLFVALIAGIEAGRRVGRRTAAAKEDGGTGAAEGVVFAVFGLIVAFTFSASATRFNDRRKLIVEQANALGTANLRLDALDPGDRGPIRRKMLQWVRLAQDLSSSETDVAGRAAVLAQAAQLQGDVWRMAAAGVERKQQPAIWGFVMPPINDWMDLSSTRQAQDDLGTPPMVMPTVIVLSLAASVLVGYRMSRQAGRNVLHRVAFSAILSLLMLVILDLDHPRSGLIQVRSADQSMAQVEQSLNAALGGQ